MYLEFYGLREQPFGVTPDPRYLYWSATHREALASLAYGIEAGRGFLALIAVPGMGKTTLLLQLLEHLRTSARTVFMYQTQCDSREFLRYLLSDLGIEAREKSIAEMQEKVNEVLVEEARAGRRFALVIDEAQNLDCEVLETVRLLSNFETRQAKLMQIVLAGQPNLATRLASPDLVQLRQRVSILSRLKPLTPSEVEEYVSHRLHIAGLRNGTLFARDALAVLAEHSGGIPRNINNFCFNALSLSYALGQKKIDAEIMKEVIKDLQVEPVAGETSLPAPPPVAPHASRATEQPRHKRAGLVLRGAVATVVLVLGILAARNLGLGFRATPQVQAVAESGAAPRLSNGADSTLSAGASAVANSAPLVRAKAPLAAVSVNSAGANSEPVAPTNNPVVAPDSPSAVDANIPAPPPRQLTVVANVEGAEISVDGRTNPGWVAPHTFYLPVGRHQFAVRKDGYASAARALVLGEGQTRTLRLNLVRLGGELTIKSDPPSLEVFIDGRPYGASPVRAFLSVGRHEYEVRPPFGILKASVTAAVQIEQGGSVMETVRWAADQ